MKQRIITALVIIGFISFAIEISSPLFLMILTTVLLLASYEWANINGARAYGRWFYILLLLVVTLLFIDWKPSYWDSNDWSLKIQILPIFSSLLAFTVVFQTLIIIGLWVFNAKKDSFNNQLLDGQNKIKYGHLLIGCLCVPCAVLSAMLLHQQNHIELWYLICIVVAADVGGYFVGRFLGKRPLMFNVSPNKTIEGVLGGALLVSVVTLIFVINDWLLFSVSMVIITFVSFFYSLMGDLWESYMKRQQGVKDSGSILPGHGGILDRIDGYLFALPIYALYFLNS